MKNDYDVLIIGGGAAGLTAALSAVRAGKSAAVLEAAGRAGRKILASGNGRCNLCNRGTPRYFGGAGLAKSVLTRWPVPSLLRFFSELGLATYEEEGGRVYPSCGQAAAVLDVLRGALEWSGTPVFCDTKAESIAREAAGFFVRAGDQVWRASSVVIACGGMAGGRLGHDGGAYRLLTALGHTLLSPRPALSPLVAEKNAVKGLSGLRLPAQLTLCRGREPVSAACGEALFTDYGVSGVCAMQLSRAADEILRSGRQATLFMDFSPMLGLAPRIYDRVPALDPEKNAAAVLSCLRERAGRLPDEMLLRGLLPRLLREKLQGLPLPQLAKALCAYEVPLVGVKGFESAQVTAGGLDTREFDENTLESRLCPGLFAAGEMLDVDGDCGGFNLQFAFASGLIAGEEAARAAE